VSHALDVVRAFRHYARADDTATEQEAAARTALAEALRAIACEFAS
jgi:hypothetical protein